VLGRIGLDLYALEHGRRLADVDSFSRDLGGSSANTAVGLARLGRRVGIVSCVARDALAPSLLGFLAREGVSARELLRVDLDVRVHCSIGSPRSRRFR
jgi:5-dehydro-2-deoxygluconokinase